MMNRYYRPAVSLFAGMAVWTGMMINTLADEAELTSQPGFVKSEFIYEKGAYPQIHATTIEEGKAGFVAAWFGGTKEKDPDVGIWVSRLVDGKWTDSVEVANGVQYKRPDGSVHRHPTWNPVLFQPKEGPLMLFFKAGPNPDAWWGMLMTSEDGGKTWSEPHRLPEGILGPIKNRPVQLDDGTIICPSSNETPEHPSKWSVHFERTKDLGKTWDLVGPVNDGVAIQAIQPSILKLGGDKLLAIGRSRQDRIFEVASNDGGKTWSKMSLGTLPNNNSGTDALTLQDGRHLIVYNHIGGTPGRWGGKRTPLNVSISKDGRNWQAALILENEPGEYSYPSLIQSKDGMVHITYTWKRERVKHVVVDPAKLEPKELINGRWPDVADPAVATLTQADDERVAAFLSADENKLNALLSSELNYAHSSGVVDSRESLIKSLTSGTAKYLQLDYEERSFDVIAPGAATMKGRVKIKVQTPKGLVEATLSYLAVWREENGKWKFLAWQSCKLPVQEGVK